MRIKEFFINIKVYLQRAMTYVGLPMSILNFTLILINTAILTQFKSYNFIFFIGLGLFFGLLTLGYFDVKFGLIGKEQDIYFQTSETFIQIHEKLDRIEKKVKK